jgi:hypothetical protein
MLMWQMNTCYLKTKEQSLINLIFYHEKLKKYGSLKKQASFLSEQYFSHSFYYF